MTGEIEMRQSWQSTERIKIALTVIFSLILCAETCLLSIDLETWPSG